MWTTSYARSPSSSSSVKRHVGTELAESLCGVTSLNGVTSHDSAAVGDYQHSHRSRWPGAGLEPRGVSSTRDSNDSAGAKRPALQPQLLPARKRRDTLVAVDALDAAGE